MEEEQSHAALGRYDRLHYRGFAAGVVVVQVHDEGELADLPIGSSERGISMPCEALARPIAVIAEPLVHRDGLPAIEKDGQSPARPRPDESGEREIIGHDPCVVA